MILKINECKNDKILEVRVRVRVNPNPNPSPNHQSKLKKEASILELLLLQ